MNPATPQQNNHNKKKKIVWCIEVSQETYIHIQQILIQQQPPQPPPPILVAFIEVSQ